MKLPAATIARVCLRYRARPVSAVTGRCFGELDTPDMERPVNYELRFIFRFSFFLFSKKQRGSRSRKL